MNSVAVAKPSFPRSSRSCSWASLAAASTPERYSCCRMAWVAPCSSSCIRRSRDCFRSAWRKATAAPSTSAVITSTVSSESRLSRVETFTAGPWPQNLNWSTLSFVNTSTGSATCRFTASLRGVKRPRRPASKGWPAFRPPASS